MLIIKCSEFLFIWIRLLQKYHFEQTLNLAESKRFELLIPFGMVVFKTTAISHSANSPENSSLFFFGKLCGQCLERNPANNCTYCPENWPHQQVFSNLFTPVCFNGNTHSEVSVKEDNEKDKEYCSCKYPIQHPINFILFHTRSVWCFVAPAGFEPATFRL